MAVATATRGPAPVARPARSSASPARPGIAAVSVTVTRPAGFTGSSVVTATDSVLAARTNRLRIIFN
ncbi:MAG TPA: hypothetical protein VEX43_01990 [Chthoniobacterales bacterium]|nr:hypothetical protein [Chthoniobacterales bacterium]